MLTASQLRTHKSTPRGPSLNLLLAFATEEAKPKETKTAKKMCKISENNLVSKLIFK
jgi:hypothetical protein